MIQKCQTEKKATSCSLKVREQKILQGVRANASFEQGVRAEVYVEYCKVLELKYMLNIAMC